jgi:hypothetical protein
LASGASNTGVTMVTIPAGTPVGKRFLIAFADASSSIPESNESDNTRVKTIYVGPDLGVLKLTVPTSAAPGQMISVSDTTKNSGGAPTVVTTVTRFYLSLKKKLDGSAVPLGPGRNVPALAVNATSMATIDLSGRYDVKSERG